MKWTITMHWTAGADGVNEIEKNSYHFVVTRDGKIVEGVNKPEDNIPPLRKGKYAASTLNFNNYNISVSLDAMAGAKEHPFDAGKFPITQIQLEAMVSLIADLSVKYGVPVTRDRILSHAEVQPTLGVRQRNKWDITWLPDMKKPEDPVKVGDTIRNMIKEKISNNTTPKQPSTTKLLGIFLGWAKKLFKRA
jgi:N-acetyl-anhydromuramyl-L-alanine amidase AmpD